MTELYDARSDTQKLIDDIKALRAELALVRRDWQADVGTLTARAQTAEALAEQAMARAERAEEQAFCVTMETYRTGLVGDAFRFMRYWRDRSCKQSEAARKVAQAYRKLDAENNHWFVKDLKRIKASAEDAVIIRKLMAELDAARAEAARLDKQNWNLCARINASEYARMTAEAETACWKYETRKYTCRCAGDDHHDGCTYATIAAALRGPARSDKGE